MFDQWEYTIPANTSKADAIRLPCKISPGTLTYVGVYFPYGCHGRARCRVLLGEKPIAPRSGGHYLAGEGFPIEATRLDETIDEDLPVLNWIMWNLDTKRTRTLWLLANWIPLKESYEKQTASTLKEFVSLMKRLIGV